MSAAEDLFQLLQGLKREDGSGRSSQERLIEYCTNVLGSIERVHVDFKEKSNSKDSKLSDDDKKNLAKAVSGFANSSGGVLVWGIEDSSITPKPIADIKRFVSALLKFAPQTTDPIVPGIDGDWIPSSSGKPDEGFGLIYVPESPLPPHRVLLKKESIKDLYFVRSGEAFVVASHTLLEDMFGRRPHPRLEFMAKPGRAGGIGGFSIVVGIRNTGRGIAKFPYLAIDVQQPYLISEYQLDGNGHPGLPLLVQHLRTGRNGVYGGSASIVIYPESELEVTLIQLEKQYANKQGESIPDFLIQYSICCEGVQMQKGEKRISGSLLQMEYLRNH